MKNLVNDNLTIEKGGGLFIFGYEAYEGYKRRMEEDPKRGKVDAAASAILEATGIPAMHTIAVKKQKENEGQPGKAAVETMFEWTKAIIVGGVEYVIDKAKNIPKARQEFVDMRIAEMDANRRDRLSKEKHEQQKKYIYDELIKEGATSAGADRAVAALDRGDPTPLKNLKRVLKIKKGIKDEPVKEDKAVLKETLNKKVKAPVAIVTDMVKNEQPTVTAENGIGTKDDSDRTSAPSSAGVDSEPRNDAGEKVDAGAYGQGDRIVTKDGTEYEKKGSQWVKTGSNCGAYEPTDGKVKAPDASMAGGESVGQVAGAGHSGSKLNNADSDSYGKSSGLDWAQNINVTKSYQDGQRSKSKGKAKENLKNTGLTTSERLTAGEAEDQQQKGVITSQGMETNQNVGRVQQEGKSAQDANKIMSDTSIGTILAGGLMGGLSSGVATGLDNMFGTLGRGAGEQVSVKTGIQPPPPHGTGSSNGTGTSAGDGSSGGTGTATGTGTSGGTGASAGTGATNGSGTASGTDKPPQKVTMTYAGTFRGTTTVTAAFGKRGTLRCSYTASFRVTLHPNGTATGEQNGGAYTEFDEFGNGLSCSPVAAQSTYTGTHANGRVTLNRPNRSYSGQYTASTLTASGGGAGQMTLTGPRAGGKPASDRVSGSMSLRRQ